MVNKKQSSSKVEGKHPKTATETDKSTGKVILEWQAPEYIQYHKSKRWYVIAAIIVLIVAIVSLITGNWTMSLATITFAGVYLYLHKHHPPKIIKIKVTDMGIKVGKVFIPYSHMKAFWIIYHEGMKTLNLSVMKSIYSDVVIHLNGQDPAEIRKILVSQVPEWEGKNERLSDVFLRLLRL